MTNYGDEATSARSPFGRHALVADFNDRARELLTA